MENPSTGTNQIGLDNPFVGTSKQDPFRNESVTSQTPPVNAQQVGISIVTVTQGLLNPHI